MTDTMADMPDIVDAKVEKTFELALRSHMTSGYQWHPLFDASKLALVGRRRVANMRSFGAAGQEIFKFRPLARGDVGISFELMRPLEGSAVDRRDYRVHVE
jgi:predicted secreted protein